MRRLLFSFSGAILFLWACSPSPVLDHTFSTFTGSEAKVLNPHKQGTVIMFLSPDCPLCHSYSLSFNQFHEKHGDQLAFYGVLSGELYNDDEIRHYIDSFDFSAPIILDPDLQLANELGASVTPHIFLLDSSGNTVYNGKVDNWAISLARKKIKADSLFLKWAIDDHINGREVQISHTKPVGCVLEY